VVRLGIVIALACLSEAAGASLCLDDRVGLNRATIAALQQELQLLTASENCAVPVVIRAEAPGKYPGALGLAWRRGEVIQPRIEVYVNPVLRLLGPARVPSMVGRALARVIAHELVHYQRQQLDHEGHGLMQPVFRADRLAAENRRTFIPRSAKGGS
jgi:hypothetical protein